MAKTAADQPIENTDDLSPVTVKIGEDADDAEDVSDVEDTTPTDQPPQAAQGQAPTPGQPGKPSRVGGAPNRPSKFLSRGDYDKGMSELRQTVQQLQQQNMQLQGQIQGFMASGGGGGGKPNGQPASQEEQQLGQINQQMRQLMQLNTNPDLTPEQRDQLGAQFLQLEQNRKSIERQVLEREITAKVMQKLQGNMPDPQVSAWTAALGQEFPHVMENETACAIAKSYYEKLVKEDNGRESLGRLRQAAAWAAQVLNLGSPRGPTNRDRAAGAGALGTGGQRGNGEVTFEPKHLKVMAGSGVTPEQVAAYMMQNPEE